MLIAGLIILGLFFFLPLGPNRLGADDFNKTFLLWLVVPITLVIFLIQEFRSGVYKWQRSKLDWPILIFLLAIGLATIFSQDVFSSVYGARTAIALPFLSLVMLTGLYFLVVQVLKENQIQAILKIIVASLSAVVVWGLMIVLGAWLEIINDRALINTIFRSAIGTLEDLAIYVAIANVFFLGVLSSNELKPRILTKKWQLISLRLVWLLTWVLLTTINFIPAWWALLVGVVIIGVYKIKSSSTGKRSALIKSSLIILIPLVFLVADYAVLDQEVHNRRLASRLQLDREHTWALMLTTLKNKPLNGYGPETFNQVFSEHRPGELNATPYWYLRFNRGAIYIYELIITAGLIGALTYLFLLGVLIFSLTKFFKRARDKSQLILMSAVLGGLITTQFVFTLNLWLMLLFWLMLALSQVAMGTRSVVDVQAKETIGKFQLVAIGSFGLVLIMMILASVSLKYWLAEAYFQNGKGTEAQMIKAAQLNPERLEYHIALAKYYKNQALAQAANATSQTALVNLGQSVAASRRWAEQAIAVVPNSVVAHESLGMVLRDLKAYFENGEAQAIESFKRATELEPTNPVLLTELGILYLGTQQTEKALDSFLMARELKPSYFAAEFNLAKTYAARGEYQDAIMILEKLATERKTTELFYELGRAYFNAGNLEEAVKSFNQVIVQDPLHANALYSLGLALIEVGDKAEALYFLNKVLDLNPNNIEVQAKIRALE